MNLQHKSESKIKIKKNGFYWKLITSLVVLFVYIVSAWDDKFILISMKPKETSNFQKCTDSQPYSILPLMNPWDIKIHMNNLSSNTHEYEIIIISFDLLHFH